MPVKRILAGTPADLVASRDALADPAALDAFERLAAERTAPDPPPGAAPAGMREVTNRLPAADQEVG